MSDTTTRIRRLEARAFRCPLARPVETSFGIMHDRPAVFLRIEDDEGAFGWGEIFANWPAAGAEHRVRLLERDLAPLVLGEKAGAPEDLFHRLEAETRIRALQCGEPGPFRQVIAGIDIALWDLVARRAGQPLRRVLSDQARAAMPAYASGIHIAEAGEVIERARRAGFRDFKVKVGFDRAEDPRRVQATAAGLEPGESLCADANQAWGLEAAQAFLSAVAPAGLRWMEEPMPADAPAADWAALAAASAVPLAGGENLAGYAEFHAAVDAGALRVIQPDIAKWGGLTGCRDVARKAMAAGHRYCPHFLGGGIGLAASAELLAAVGGDGLLEVDVNPNPLREAFADVTARLADGRWQGTEAPGLGIETLPEELTQYQTASAEVH
jgi:L-alanine-DL-glutamate epimerase-like enolase superfamily enzyme